ncbi:hypothetical protein J3T65_07400 [Staphylococcus simiae]|uniref:hypothetical protein n=1 Tax=Staphylococcus simiae TaxID=308354 RepID=UPI001A96C129|nr:hypothetical protein [Staphylococcus simiae]MBO1199305.1 hypothetical protein [Staphylococcus simiae]MBO1201538.1 hypothetical protein [Staphylococcus simiae]MBO1203715.1 hypothetical protein [Staphylococcus simiae]MBO1211320.1 hypothetical protein [Staphylococcus simiae]MBO1229919.1 hypothetical protein [Staphylococcus simiae]
MELIDYNMFDDEMVAIVQSDKGQLFKYSFDTTTPEYKILEVLKELNKRIDEGQHPLGCTLIKRYDFDDVNQAMMTYKKDDSRN